MFNFFEKVKHIGKTSDETVVFSPDEINEIKRASDAKENNTSPEEIEALFYNLLDEAEGETCKCEKVVRINDSVIEMTAKTIGAFFDGKGNAPYVAVSISLDEEVLYGEEPLYGPWTYASNARDIKTAMTGEFSNIDDALSALRFRLSLNTEYLRGGRK